MRKSDIPEYRNIHISDRHGHHRAGHRPLALVVTLEVGAGLVFPEFTILPMRNQKESTQNGECEASLRF